MQLAEKDLTLQEHIQGFKKKHVSDTTDILTALSVCLVVHLLVSML